MFYKKLTLFHIRGSRKKYFSGWVQNNIFVCWKVRWSKAYLCIFTMLKSNKFFSRVAEGDPRFSSRSAHVQNKFSNCKFKYASFFLKKGEDVKLPFILLMQRHRFIAYRYIIYSGSFHIIYRTRIQVVNTICSWFKT